MVKTEKNTLIIILPHSRPLEALAELQTGIIDILKFQLVHFDNLHVNDQRLINGYSQLLELLEATLQTDQNDTDQ